MIDSISDRAELVFPDGTRERVSCEIAVHREYGDDNFPIRSKIVGRVWKPADQSFASRNLGKECILEIDGRRLSMYIADKQGTIGVSGGIVEGFADLKG